MLHGLPHQSQKCHRCLLPHLPSSKYLPLLGARDILADKHPASVVPSSEILLPVDQQSVAPNPIIFDSLNADLTLKAAFRTKGAAGLSGLTLLHGEDFVLRSNLPQETFAAPLLRLVIDYVHP